jgi:hypothetical protein
MNNCYECTFEVELFGKVLTVKASEYWEKKGTELNWEASVDDRIVAGDEIYRDNKLIDFVAIGSFYFDVSEGNNPKAKYKIVAVDGDGNKSK